MTLTLPLALPAPGKQLPPPPNFVRLACMTRNQLDIAERVYQMEALEADRRGRVSRAIGARQWLTSIGEERARRASR